MQLLFRRLFGLRSVFDTDMQINFSTVMSVYSNYILDHLW